jgi:outer membrane biosynthesis protein TonB
MTNSFRLTFAAMAFAALAGCSRTSEPPALSDDLKQDLARAGAADVQLAGAAGPRVEVVSAAERVDGAVAAPKAPTKSRTTSATRGTSAPVRSPRPETPVAAEPAPRPREVAPVEMPTAAPAPEPVPSQRRPQAPQPSTQREPPGGWKTPGQVIRNAPFPINP